MPTTGDLKLGDCLFLWYSPSVTPLHVHVPTQPTLTQAPNHNVVVSQDVTGSLNLMKINNLYQ